MANIPFLNNAYFSAKVGIGTDSPSSTLTISSSVGGDATWNKSGILIENTSTTTGEPTLAFRNAGTGGTGANYWHTGLNQSNTYKIAYGTSFTDGNTKFELSTNGALRLNSYTQGFLQTDANGNVNLTGGGTLPGGPYLPLAGGTMTGDIDFVNNKDISMTDNAGAVTRVMILNASNSMYIGPVDAYAGGSILYGVAAGVSFQRFFTGASERLRIGSNGNVAIGTTATSYRLQVEQDNDGNLLSRFHNTAANGQGLLIRAGGVSSANRILQLASENDTKVMTVNSNGRVGIGIANSTSLLEISKQLSAASTIDYPYTISSRDDGNSINQAGGEGVGIKFRIAGNAATTPGDSLVGASIAAIREMASDTDSSTGLGFFVTQNDETLDEALRIDHDRNANFLSNVNITNSLDVTDTIDIGTQTWKGYTNTPAKLNVEVSGGRAINIYNTEESAAYLSFIDSQSDDGQYANLSFNSSGTNAFIINNMGYETTISNVGAWTFTEAVSGITPTADANFVTKAYADGLTPGAGVFLPLAGGVMTGPVDFNGTSGDHGEFEWTSGDGTTGDVWSLGFYQNSSSQASIEFYTATEALANGNISFKTGGTTNTLVLNADQDASFRGNIAVGNVALGTDTLTPMASITLPGNAKLFGYANSIYSISNAYYDGGWKYLTTNSAAVLNIGTNGASALTLRQAASGTADDAITFTTSFEIDSSGDATFSGTVDAPTFEGNLTGNVTGNLTGVVNSTSSLADGVIGATQADGDDSTLIATTAFVQNLIETIPAGLVFQGTWDARTAAEGGATGDEGSPALVSGVGTTGHFYIVSNSGSVDLDGITDWVTGDWAVFVEVGATDSWQKIDNSSVLDGSGTGQTLPLWSGSGTSNTLTDSVVTQDSTNIGIGIAIPLHKLDIESDDNSLIKIRNTTNGGGASIEFNDNSGSTDTQNGQITYYHSDSASQGGGASFWFEAQPDTTLVVGNGTNTGRVVVGGNSATEVGYGFYDDINTGMFKPANHQLGFATNGTNRLTISTIIQANSPIKTILGTAAIPALQIGDSDSGFYDSGANLISVSLGGVKSATFHDGGRFQAVSSIQAGDDTNTAGASRVGAMRYRTGTEYVEVTGAELIPQPLDFTDGWNSIGSTTTITADTFVTVTSAGGVRKPTFLTVGQVYRLKISGTTTTTNNQINNYANNSNYKTWSGAGAFDFTFTFTATTDGGLYLRLYPGTAEIYSLSVMEVTEEDASYADMCMQTGASEYEWVNIVRNTY